MRCGCGAPKLCSLPSCIKATLKRFFKGQSSANSFAHWWWRVGFYRDQAAAYIKIPLDYMIVIGGAAGTGVGLIPLYITITVYAFTFSSFVMFGWHYVHKWHIARYGAEFGSKINQLFMDIHKAAKNNKSNGNKNNHGSG